MKQVALALAAGGSALALLLTFYLPVMKTSWHSKVALDYPGFVRIWQVERLPIYPLGLTGEIAVGLFVAAVVYAASGHRRDAARWR
jgi:hypothetical protein